MIQVRMPLTLSTWAHCWLMFSRLSTNTPRSFSTEQLSSDSGKRYAPWWRCASFFIFKVQIPIPDNGGIQELAFANTRVRAEVSQKDLLKLMLLDHLGSWIISMQVHPSFYFLTVPRTHRKTLLSPAWVLLPEWSSELKLKSLGVTSSSQLGKFWCVSRGSNKKSRAELDNQKSIMFLKCDC